MTEKKRVVVLISGRGSNMSALIEAAKEENFPAEIVGVISNKPDAQGLATAQAEGIPTAIASIKEHGGKAQADAAITHQLKVWHADIVCLAGFMRLLTAEFCETWEGQLINIHPSLLPAFKGLNTHERALEDGVTEHGCTVHFVTAGMDEGPVIGQVIVPIEYGDTPRRLAGRVLNAEHKLYPWALAQVATNKIVFNQTKTDD